MLCKVISTEVAEKEIIAHYHHTIQIQILIKFLSDYANFLQFLEIEAFSPFLRKSWLSQKVKF